MKIVLKAEVTLLALALTAVGDRETVGHFQIVNVGRQSEFRGAELNHPYPKRAVLLIRAPRKQTPCESTHERWLSIKTCLGSQASRQTFEKIRPRRTKTIFNSGPTHPPAVSPRPVWTPTDLNAGRASQRAAPQNQQHGHGQIHYLLHVCSPTRQECDIPSSLPDGC